MGNLAERTGSRVLVVEDSEDLQAFLRAVLESAGHTVILAANGEEGLEALRACRPDVVVTDVSMPVMDGLELMLRVKSELAPPLPPIVVCSGFEGAKEEALRLGAFRFVLKPVDPDSLLAIVDAAVRDRPVDAATVAKASAYAEAARAKATAASRQLLRGVRLDARDILQGGTRFAQLLSCYFDDIWAEVLLVDEGPLRAIGRSDGCPTDVPIELAFYSSAVLASGSSLVLTDAGRALSGPRATHGVGFFVGVPLVFGGVPIGAICVMAREPRGFAAEDLLILEMMGRSASSLLPSIFRAREQGTEMGRVVGLMQVPVFETMLGAELRLVNRAGGGIDLLVAEIVPSATDDAPALAAIVRAGKSARMAACLLPGGRLAVYKRGKRSEECASALSGILGSVGEAFTIRASGWVSVMDDGLPLVSPSTLLQLGLSALEENLRDRKPSPAHVVLRRIASPP